MPRYPGSIPQDLLLLRGQILKGQDLEHLRRLGKNHLYILKPERDEMHEDEAAVEMAESILKDKKKILPCAAYLDGEYGFKELFIGVPVKLGKGGIVDIIEIDLTDEEKVALKKSADAVQGLKEDLKKLS